MQAIYEYTGIVETVCELQTFASGFTKQDLVLTDDNDVQTKYPNHIAFSFKKDINFPTILSVSFSGHLYY